MAEAKKETTVQTEVEVPHSSKPTPEEQRALDAQAEEADKREKLMVRSEAARFVRLKQGE